MRQQTNIGTVSFDRGYGSGALLDLPQTLFLPLAPVRQAQNDPTEGCLRRQ